MENKECKRLDTLFRINHYDSPWNYALTLLTMLACVAAICFCPNPNVHIVFGIIFVLSIANLFFSLWIWTLKKKHENKR